MTLFKHIISLFIAPGEFFEEFRDQAESSEQKSGQSLFWPPVILLVIAGLVSMFYLRDLAKDAQFQQVTNRIENNAQLTPEQKDDAMTKMKDRFDNPSPAIQAVSWTVSGLNMPIRAAFMALMALVIGNFIFGGQASYGTIFGITAWSYLVSILELIVKIPLMLTKWTMEIYTGLGLLNLGAKGGFVNTFFAGIDLFALWRIVLIAIGLGVIYKKGTGKYMGALLVLWFVLLLITAGIAAVFN